LPLLSACEELFNRASAPFCMLAGSTRTAVPVIARAAPSDVATQWIPRLLSGEWSATICISEPDAGSDVGRIRTAACNSDGVWRVSGEKCWISYGDHDATARIGHMALARSTDGAGVRGLGLFLIPSTRDDGSDNGVRLRRIEEKLGLHCSPTCQIGFEEAEAVLLGQEGRGLQTLFEMMLLMRLSCGPQGTGVASAAFAAALGYAQDRRQGGAADKPPVPIVAHTDVQRQLLDMAASVELSRGLNLAAAAALDLGRLCPDKVEAARWMDLAQFLLPLVKDGAARTAFDVSSAAIQVLGGAGYTTEWPVERYLRDARVFSVFEGTTGMQALDILHRRVWRDNRAGLAAFLEAMREDAADSPALASAVASLAGAAETLAGLEARPREAEAGAVAFLDLCRAVAWGWIAARTIRLAGDDPLADRMKAAARYHLSGLPAQAACLEALVRNGAKRLEGISAFLAD
jgi:alkylation response protein AidB-like acyl-CoA dehydrogenase